MRTDVQQRIYIFCLNNSKRIGIINDRKEDLYEKDNKSYIDVPENKCYKYCRAYLNPILNDSYQTLWDVGNGDKTWHWSRSVFKKWKRKNMSAILRCYKLSKGTRISDGIEFTYNAEEVHFNLTETKEIMDNDKDDIFPIVKDIGNLPWKPYSVIRVTMDTLPKWLIDKHVNLHESINNVEYWTSHYDIINIVIKVREELTNKSCFTKKSVDLLNDMFDLFMSSYDCEPSNCGAILSALREIKHHQGLLLSTSQ